MRLTRADRVAESVLSSGQSPAQGYVAQIVNEMCDRALSHRRDLRPVPPPFDELSRDVATEIADRWKAPCEAAFEHLADIHPGELVRLIGCGRLDAADLTFAAEILGRVRESDLVRRTLLPLLDHGDAAVREGAIYGLARHLDAAVRAKLHELAGRDPSRAVKIAAADALDS